MTKSVIYTFLIMIVSLLAPGATGTGYFHQLKLAFTSVIGNSIRRSGPAVCVDITTHASREKGRRCFVTAITDDGFGIPDDVKRTIFEANGKSAAIPPGKGLWLYTAKALAEASGGRLELRDRMTGDYRKGTKVTITLPAAEGS